MKAIKRTKSPDFLKANKKSWTSSYINGAAFTWHNKQKEIIAELRKMSQNHCAFCDDLLFPLVGEHGEIEHFKPKEQFKHYAYAWANLYPICRRCNGTKNDRFDKLLLRPDTKNYHFDDWFWFDPSTFEIKPITSNSNYARAQKTIEIFGLNKEDKITRRQFEFIKIITGNYATKNEQPFRFI